jgi:Family of unknown function (DUF5808)
VNRPSPETLWADPANWRAGLIYVCEDDPRLIVPKRLRWSGYTLNFAHSTAGLTLVGMLAALLAPFMLLLFLQPPEVFIAVGVSFFVVVAVLALICHREANSTR